jgi:DNA-binding MarR family transcriptional regulator
MPAPLLLRRLTMAQSPSKDSSSPLDLLHRASLQADSLFTHNVGDVRLTPRQYAVLRAVSQANGLSQTAIMAATGIDKSSTAELVRRLVSFGALQRRRTKRDARQYAVRLTPKGRDLVAVGQKAAQLADEFLLARVPLALQRPFLQALQFAALRDFRPTSGRE